MRCKAYMARTHTCNSRGLYPVWRCNTRFCNTIRGRAEVTSNLKEGKRAICAHEMNYSAFICLNLIPNLLLNFSMRT